MSAWLKQGCWRVLAKTRRGRMPTKVAHISVHGRDDAAKNEMALFLRAIGLEPIILHLRPNGGRHLLTKLREEVGGSRLRSHLDDAGG